MPTMFAIIMQAAERPILPNDFAGWLGLVVQTIVIIGAVGGLLWRVVLREMKTFDTNVGHRFLELEIDVKARFAGVTKSVDSHEERLRQADATLDKMVERNTELTFGLRAQGDALARLEGSVERLATMTERRQTLDTELTVRLTRIEESLKAVYDHTQDRLMLKAGFDGIAAAIRGTERRDMGR